MKIFRWKIKEQFLNSIESGVKQHEYRLLTEERQKVNVGDILILTSTTNKDKYVKVLVESIEKFTCWDEALNNYWQNDFPGFSSIDEIKHECYKFYTKEQVDSCGIIVFKIKKYFKSLKNSRVLLDTNIVIHREGAFNVAYEVIQLYKLLDKLNCQKYLLPEVEEELSSYKDDNIKKNIIEKTAAYNILGGVDAPDDFFTKVVSKYKLDKNSTIDNKHLFKVYSGLVDFLITDDKLMLQKARELQISDSVFSSFEFLSFAENEYPALIDYKMLSVKLNKVREADINDKFFDSLREDYGGIKFNQWMINKSNEDAYMYKNSKNELKGFLLLKIEGKDEDYSDIVPTFKPTKRLKVCTFKIDSTGMRVGERFLKIIFDYALKSKVNEIYVTMFENKRDEVKALISLMKKWGFYEWGHKNSNGELVMIKSMDKYFIEKDPKFNYPFIKENANYGFLPIQACWHTELFPDSYLKTEDIKLFEEKPCSYATEKIYISGKPNSKLHSGDVLAIYRMHDGWYKGYKSCVTGYAIIQNIYYPKDFDEYKKICSNKSVFNDAQLESMYYVENRRTVIDLLFVKSFDSKIILNDLIANSIIDPNRGPRISTLMTKEQFEKIIKLGDNK